MENKEIYNEFLYNTLNQIYLARMSLNESQILINRENYFFDFYGKEYDEYHFIINSCKDIIYEELIKLIIKLLENNKTVMFEVGKICNYYSIIIIENNNRTLYVFSEFGIRYLSLEPIIIKKKAEGYIDIDDYKFIIYDNDYAYSAAFNHNEDEKDPSRGTNMYSLKYFFEKYFGEEEYETFKAYETKLTEKAKTYLGMSVIQYLTPNMVDFFKLKVKQNIHNFDYNKFVLSDNSDFGRIKNNYKDSIDKHFGDERMFEALLSDNKFAKSFITAEWLYSSLNTSHNINQDETSNIDLTSIALGYFKCMEQMLTFIITKFHKTDKKKRYIKSNGNLKHAYPNPLDYPGAKNIDGYIYVEVNEDSIRNKYIDTTLGSLKYYFYDEKNNTNKDLLLPELVSDDITYQFIGSVLNHNHGLRNGYIHKDNLYSWSEINQIRINTYILIYLFLGAYKYTDDQKKILGIKKKNDFVQLFNYVVYHGQEIFYIDFGDGKIKTCQAHVQYNKSGEIVKNKIFLKINESIPKYKNVMDVKDKEIINKYSFKDIQSTPYTEADLSGALVYTGKTTPVAAGLEFSGPLEKIYENGLFLKKE